jgi:hypothetical protein
MLGEWSSVPRDLQPYLAEFLVRCVLPLQRFTVKVAPLSSKPVSGLRSTERRWALSSARHECNDHKAADTRWTYQSLLLPTRLHQSGCPKDRLLRSLGTASKAR